MLDTLTLAQLAAAYNAAQIILGRDADSHVKKFADKKSGLARVEKAQQELVAMYGQAEVTVDGSTMGWDVETRKPRQQGKTLSTLDLSAQLTVLADQNPKRPNSRSRVIFDLYTGCATGEDYIAAMIKAGYSRKLALAALHWDTDHKFVKLG